MTDNQKCNLEFDFKGDKSKLINELKKAVESSGGTFNGDKDKGECYGSSPVKYHLEYEFQSIKLIIRILKKPVYISCSLIESTITQFLKNFNKQLIINLINMKKIVIETLDGPKEYAIEINAPESIDSPNEDGGIFVQTEKASVVKIKLMTLGDVTETKADTCLACTDTPFGRICTDVPCVYTRKCDKTAMLEVNYPGNIEESFKKAMEECAKISLALVVPLLLSGQFQAAIPIFFGAFKECLISKGYQEATKISVNIYEKKSCGSWSRV